MDELPRFDHTSIGVHDAEYWGRLLCSEMGAAPLLGEVLPDFRYVLLELGDAHNGGRLELMDSRRSEGFLGRFLDKHGEGPHHLCFVVPDLEATLSQVRALGFKTVGVDLTHSPWREAFIMPDDLHGIVIQIADSIYDYPTAPRQLHVEPKDVDDVPGSRGGAVSRASRNCPVAVMKPAR